jgi:uncharacterized protein (TIGR02996 family)
VLAEKWAAVAAKDRVTFQVRRAAPTAGKTPARDEAALRAAIVEDPDDPAPRHVYADWLLEQGRPLGEYMALSRAPGDHKKAQRALAERLWAGLGAITKFSELRDFVDGFVTQVCMNVPELEKHGDAFFREHPIRTLDLKWERLTAAHLERLANLPALARVRCLKLELGAFTQMKLPLAGLARGNRLDRLEELRLANVGVSAKDWQELFGKLDAPRLKKVWMQRTRTSSTTLLALARNRSANMLEELYEEQDRCLDRAADRDWRASFAALAAERPSLRRLSLDDLVGLDDAALEPLFARESKVRLEELSLWGVDTTDAFVETIASSPRANRLAALTLPRGMATPRAIEALASAKLVPLAKLVLQVPASARAQRELFEALLAVPTSRALKKLRFVPKYTDHPQDALRERFEVS